MKKIAASLLIVLTLSFATSTANAQTYAPAYGQCGGLGWTGPTLCVPGFACIVHNVYYHQCLPYPG